MPPIPEFIPMSETASTPFLTTCPENHRFPGRMDTRKGLMKWAGKVGPNTSEYITKVMQTRPHPEQGFRSCLGILKLGDTYGSKTLEKACIQGLAIKKYSYKSLKIILDNLPDERETETEQPLPLHSNIRGKEYFKTGRQWRCLKC